MFIELELLVEDLRFKLQLYIDRYRLDVLTFQARDSHAEALIIQVVQCKGALVIHETNRNFLLKDTHR